MITTIYVIAGLVVLGLCYFIWQRLEPYRRFRGKMVVTCPETHQAAGVAVDAPHVAFTAVRGGPDLRLKECSRWPERQNCGQECLAQIERSPESCLVRMMLTHWYQGKSCAFCGKAFEHVDSYDHQALFLYDQKPALISPEGQLFEWSAVPVEALPQVLTTHKPVCWNCLVTMTFRRDHPELVTNRPPKRSH